MATIIVAASALFFPTTKTKAPDLQVNSKLNPVSQSRQGGTATRDFVTPPLFKQANWDVINFPVGQSVINQKLPFETSRIVNFSPPANNYLQSIFSIFKTNETKPTTQKKAPDMIKPEQFWRQTFTTDATTDGTSASTARSGPYIPRATVYYPIRNSTAVTGMEGGFITSRSGPDGRAIPHTAMEYLRVTEANGGVPPRDAYITLAGNSMHYGEEYTINNFRFQDENGAWYTINGARGVVHDAGNQNEWRFFADPNHFDVAADASNSDGAASGLSGGAGTEFIPVNDAARSWVNDGRALNQTSQSGGSAGGTGGVDTSQLTGNAGAYPSGIGAWVDRTAENVCYKHMGTAGGSNQYMVILTCNSGFAWSKTKKPVPIPVVNCGKRLKPGSPTENGCIETATLQAGQKIEGPGAYACLWLACKKGANAIYDRQSKICGCDDGAGGLGSGLANGAGEYDPEDFLGQSGDDNDGSPDNSLAQGTPGTDAYNRKALEDAGINVNAKAPQTNLAGLSNVTIDNLKAIKTACPTCEVTITGGTEAGHATHGSNRDIVDIRFREGSEFNNYVSSNSTKVGSNYFMPRIGGGYVRFYDEPAHTTSFGQSPRHWHVVLDSDRRP